MESGLSKLAQQEERLTRLERHEQVVTDSLDAGRRELRDLGELVQQERADRQNMARQLIELTEEISQAGRIHDATTFIDETLARLANAELRITEIARRLHLGEPGYDFPWPPIPRENRVVQVDEIPDVDHLEPGVTYISPNAVTWPISKRRWEMQQQVTEQDAHQARRLIDILERVREATDNRWGVGLASHEARILTDYLDGLDPHCAVGTTDELHPAFQITVDLDGDDDADTQTANARRALEDALEQASAGGLIRGWTLDGA